MRTSQLFTGTAVVLCALSVAACRQDMHDQPKGIPLRESVFFADQRSARPIVDRTVRRAVDAKAARRSRPSGRAPSTTAMERHVSARIRRLNHRSR